ncbi:hypothetical protein CAAN1_05S06744 [[Candida] anglica]|uniref:Cyclin N-terminal domain-containing protein n=1 Tax=[Candida] anglica TaxID=148631 RepID=A0ABP0EDT6_9ASCO
MMISPLYVDLYIDTAFGIMGSNSRRASPTTVPTSCATNNSFSEPHAYLHNLIITSQLSLQNLSISLYFLYKYNLNQVVVNDPALDSALPLYLIVTSLVLSNKTFDDQSYTLKTWVNICNGIMTPMQTPIKIDFQLLKSLEIYFMNCLDYKLSFKAMDQDVSFWNMLKNAGHSVEWTETLKFAVTVKNRCDDKFAEFSDSVVVPALAPAPAPAPVSVPTTVSGPVCGGIVYCSTPSYTSTQLISPTITPIASTSASVATSVVTTATAAAAAAHFYSPLTPITPCYQPLPKRRRVNPAADIFSSTPTSLPPADYPIVSKPRLTGTTTSSNLLHLVPTPQHGSFYNYPPQCPHVQSYPMAQIPHSYKFTF